MLGRYDPGTNDFASLAMCYSAQIWQDYRKYVRLFGAKIDIKEFVELFWRRHEDPSLKISKGLEDAFMDPQSPEEREIRGLIEQHRASLATTWEQELFAQAKRLADAERKLLTKATKAALDSKRIATNKIAQLKGRLDDLRRTDPVERDDRIFPGWYAPVMVLENGERIIKPMRYQCRPAGKPANYDERFPGTYNARRDNLGGFWKDLFGFSHGVMVTTAFFENVKLHDKEHRDLRDDESEQNVVLRFDPPTGHEMLVACLWSRWTKPGEPTLLSFAAITDEPPSEVAEAGHDRCIVPVKQEHLEAWLDPLASGKDAAEGILEDRDRPFYRHRLAA